MLVPGLLQIYAKLYHNMNQSCLTSAATEFLKMWRQKQFLPLSAQKSIFRTKAQKSILRTNAEKSILLINNFFFPW